MPHGPRVMQNDAKTRREWKQPGRQITVHCAKKQFREKAPILTRERTRVKVFPMILSQD